MFCSKWSLTRIAAHSGPFFQAHKGDVAEGIRQLKQKPGKSLLQYGVGELTGTVLKYGLVDEFRILVYPITLTT